MNKTNFHLLFLLIIIAPLFIRAQLLPEKNNYYIVTANTKPIVKNYSKEVEPDSSSTSGEKTSTQKCFALPRGSKIFVHSVNEDNVYFRIVTYNDNSCNNCTNGGDLYYIPLKEFSDKNFRFRAGFKGGLLVTPFKYRPDKKKIFPGGNLAYHGSWLINLGGLEFRPLIFAGLTTISLADTNTVRENGSGETKIGFTTGIGIGLDVFETMDFGFVVGWDFIEQSWESNGRPWYALSFNFNM